MATVRPPVPALVGPRRSLYVILAVAFVAILLAGFARTYYLKPLFGTPPLTWLVHLHGFLLTLWFALFFVQSRLVASHRVDLHRRLGIFGGILAASIIIVGIPTLVHFVTAPQSDPEVHGFLMAIFGVDSVIFILFAGFVAAALLLRGRPEVHKRLMLLATLSLLWPPMSRIPIAFISDNFVVSLLLTDLCVVACIVLDALRQRRISPVMIWGGGLNIAALHLAQFGVSTDAWMKFAGRLLL
jgi:hypothetical protein